MRKRLFLLVLATAFATAPVLARPSAQDVSGVWSGTIAIPENGQRVKRPIFASLQQDGDELTGTAGPEKDAQLPITRGHVESTKFGTFVTFDLAVSSVVMHFELRPHDGTMRGLARLEGEGASAPVELEQQK